MRPTAAMNFLVQINTLPYISGNASELLAFFVYSTFFWVVGHRPRLKPGHWTEMRQQRPSSCGSPFAHEITLCSATTIKFIPPYPGLRSPWAFMFQPCVPSPLHGWFFRMTYPKKSASSASSADKTTVPLRSPLGMAFMAGISIRLGLGAVFVGGRLLRVWTSARLRHVRLRWSA